MRRAPFLALMMMMLLSGFGGALAPARAVAPLGPEFDGVDVKNKLGQKVDTKIPLIAPDGKVLTLADFLDGKRPLVFTLNYYTCTSLCSQQLNELVDTLVGMGWAPGPEAFRIVTLSFDPSDTTDVAAGKQKSYREALVRQLAEDADDELSEQEVTARAEQIDWTFLVARDKAIMAMLDDIGYAVRRDPQSGQYAHSPVTYVLTPDGVIARYLWGLEVPPRDLKFALMDSSDGNLGGFGDKVLLSCFNYNDASGGYEAFAWGFMRIGGGLVLAVLAGWLLLHWRRERRRSRHENVHVEF